MKHEVNVVPRSHALGLRHRLELNRLCSRNDTEKTALDRIRSCLSGVSFSVLVDGKNRGRVRPDVRTASSPLVSSMRTQDMGVSSPSCLLVPIKTNNFGAQPLPHRYQGILTTTIRWLPFNSSSSFSNCTRWLCSRFSHQCLTTSSGSRTAILRPGFSSSSFRT
jgi:hypothetical protein